MALTKIPNNLIAADAITGTLIADDAINSEHIADGAIDAAHMSANSIDSDSYVDGSIDRAHISDDAINSEHIANEVVNSYHYVPGSIDTAHIGDDQVTAAKLANSINTSIAAKLPLAGGTMTGALIVTDGSTSAPSIGNSGDTNTGIYFPADDQLGLVAAGSRKIHVTASDVTFQNLSGAVILGNRFKAIDSSSHQLNFGQWDGTNHRIEADSNKPFVITSYHSGGILLGTSGNTKLNVHSTGATVTGALDVSSQVLAGAGSAAAPSYAFTAQGSTGMYKPGTSQLYFSVAGTRKIRVEASQIVLETAVYANTTLGVTGAATFAGSVYMTGTPTAPSGSAERSYIYHNNASNTSLHIGTQYGVDAAAIKFETRNTTRMQIDGDGTVQIGNPAVGSAQNLVIMPQGKLYLDAGGDTYIQESAGNVIDITTGGTRRLRVNSNGLIFGSDTAAANALNDYEEGTWTPAFYTYSGVTTSSISSYATYTKIGNICHIHAKMTVTLSSLPGQTVIITGLPFTSASSGDAGQRSIIAIGGDTQNTGGNTPKAHFRTDGTQLQGIYWNPSNNTAYWTYNAMDSSSFELQIHGFYTTT